MNLPKEVFLDMLKAKALTPKTDHRIFEINFKLVASIFPAYMEYMVKHTLNDLELWAYTEGYMAYIVLDNGLLEWRTTGKRML